MNLLPTRVILQPCLQQEVVGGAGAVFLEQPVTDAMFRPISGQACGFGFVKDFDSIEDFVSDG